MGPPLLRNQQETPRRERSAKHVGAAPVRRLHLTPSANEWADDVLDGSLAGVIHDDGRLVQKHQR